jgi:predicted permease
MLDAIVRDVRYAARVLRKTPAFTLAAVLTLALAIGVNTAVFSLVDAVLLTPLPYPDPNHLALVSRVVTNGQSVGQEQSVDGRTWELVRDTVVSAKRAVFSGWTTGVNLVLRDAKGAETADYVQQQRVGAGFFDVLGVRPMLGRELSADEDRPQGPPAVVLSAALWRRALGADPSVIGRPLMLRGEPYTIVGVMPDGFRTGERADLWTALEPTTTGEGGGTNYAILIRVGDEAARARALAEVQQVGQELIRRRATQTNDTVRFSMSLMPLQSGLTADLRQPILILWAAVGLVLVAASVNLAGLMLARSSARTREIATRLALGSGRAAVLRQLLVEALVLGVAGGALGIGVAYLSIGGLAWLTDGAYEVWQPVSLNLTSMAASAVLAIAASVVFGLGPALHATRGAHGGPRLTGSRSITDSSSHWPRRALVVVQVALGVMLLVSAGLLSRTFTHLRSLDPGFDPQRLTVASVSLEDARYKGANQVARLADAVTATLRRTPGIDAAALALGVPYQRPLNLGFRYADGPEAASETNRGAITNATYVTANFFETMRIPVRRGRAIDDRDQTTSTPVAVINDAFIRTYFKNTDPLDRRIRVSGVDRQIVGIVGDVQVKPGWGNNGPLSTMPNVYVPVTQVDDAFVRLVHTWFKPEFVVRSSLPLAQTTQAIREAVASIDPLLPLASVESMLDVRATALAQQRLLATLLVGLAIAALIVAATGIHGLIATSVTERTREMGIRLALGATSSQAVRTLALPGLVLAVIGVALGLVGARSSASLLTHFIWGIRANDPLTFGGVSALLMLTALASSVAPALRIVRLDPSKTLRAE